jgi:hypothetical protein
MASQQQEQHGGKPGTAAADNDFLPVLTSETSQEVAAADPLTTTTRSGGSTADEISAGFSAGSLARTIGLPKPRLERDFRMQARLEGKVALGRSCWGERNWIGICGGEWSAAWGKGTVVVSFISLMFSGRPRNSPPISEAASLIPPGEVWSCRPCIYHMRASSSIPGHQYG